MSAPGCTNAAGTLTCAVGTLAPREMKTFNVQVTVDAAYAGPDAIQATATVMVNGDTVASNNSASTTTTLGATPENADLGILISGSPTTTCGCTIDYVITVTNNGPATSTNGQVSYSLPAGVTLVSAPGCSESGGTLTCSVGSLASGATRTFNLQVRVDPVCSAPNPIPATATVSAAGDPNAANNSASMSTTRPAGGPTEIPTLSEWGMIMLGLLLALGAFSMRRRRGE